MELILDIIGWILLIGILSGVLYVFYRLLKFGLDTTKQHDD